MNFDEAFEKLIGHEGGYVNHPSDPGGETKFGISKRAYPGEDIKNMTLARAKELYLRDYWGPAGCDAVYPGLKFDLFDMAVNSGVKTAIKNLQKSVGFTGHDVDGILGPITLMAVRNFNSKELAVKFSANRLLFYTELSTWPAFGKGWVRRVASNLLSL